MAKPSPSIRSLWFSILITINLEYWPMLSIGTSNGANKPFLTLVVLDLWNLPGEYGIEVDNISNNI